MRERGGVGPEVGGVRREVGGVRREVGGVRREVGGVRQEVGLYGLTLWSAVSCDRLFVFVNLFIIVPVNSAFRVYIFACSFLAIYILYSI